MIGDIIPGGAAQNAVVSCRVKTLEEEAWTINRETLPLAHGCKRVHACGPLRGNPAGEQGDEGQQTTD